MHEVMVLAVLAVCASAAQQPGPQDWNRLADESNVVIVGLVEEVSQVVRPERMSAESTHLPSGQVRVNLPSPSEYGVGRLVRVRVNEVLKSDGSAKKKGMVNVFLPKLLSSEGEAVLLQGIKYVLFLRRATTHDDGNALAGARIYKPAARHNKFLRFNLSSTLRIVRGDNGVVPLTATSSKVIDQIRTAMHPR